MKPLFGISQSDQRLSQKQDQSNKSDNKAKMLLGRVMYIIFSEGNSPAAGVLRYHSAAAPVCFHFSPVIFAGYVLLYMLMVIIVESYIWVKQNVFVILCLEHK